MKTKNFPAKKKRRQLVAANTNLNSEDAQEQLNRARAIRTKKKK